MVSVDFRCGIDGLFRYIEFVVFIGSEISYFFRDKYYMKYRCYSKIQIFLGVFEEIFFFFRFYKYSQ